MGSIVGSPHFGKRPNEATRRLLGQELQILCLGARHPLPSCPRDNQAGAQRVPSHAVQLWFRVQVIGFVALLDVDRAIPREVGNDARS